MGWHVRGSVASLQAREQLALFAGRMDARKEQAAESSRVSGGPWT